MHSPGLDARCESGVFAGDPATCRWDGERDARGFSCSPAGMSFVPATASLRVKPIRQRIRSRLFTRWLVRDALGSSVQIRPDF